VTGSLLSFSYDKSNYHVYMTNIIQTDSQITHLQAMATRDEAIWDTLSKITLASAVEQFLKTLRTNTQRAYRAAFNAIFTLFTESNLFNPHTNLQTFALANIEFLLDEIRSKIPGTEATKQARAAAFIALSRYLQRATGGMIRRVVPKREKMNPTFRQIRETSVTKALSKIQWTQFLYSLKRMSFRDYLVAKTILQGAKRVSEVLFAQIDDIHWAKNQIIFKQLKSKEIEKYTVITYPDSFMQELREYIGDRQSGIIFITRNGKPLSQPHLYRIFSSASVDAGLPFTVHPHVLRASAITYLSAQGYHADQIMRVSGHADIKLVRYYDKTPIEQNPSKDISLI
jgi:integrase/recombinase XerD